jgi:hypothetical protein
MGQDSGRGNLHAKTAGSRSGRSGLRRVASLAVGALSGGRKAGPRVDGGPRECPECNPQAQDRSSTVAEREQMRLHQRAIDHDIASITLYGRDAPLLWERIWLSPADCVDSYGKFKAEQSGEVVGGDWDLHTYPVKSNAIAAACIRHWRDGVSWEEAGAYDLQLQRIKKLGTSHADGLRTLDDIIRRCEHLDAIFETIRSERRLRPRSETDDFTFRERDGVLIHVARDGRPVFGHRGVHRFVMARLLELPTMPAQLGVVHPEALSVWRDRFQGCSCDRIDLLAK